jgi:hypothetical protein
VSGPTVEQLLNIADRADYGRLQPAEVARLREGIEHLAAKPLRRRLGPPLAAARRLQRLKQRLRILHTPVLRGGVEVCRECSGWDGQRCRGLVTPYPCPTVEVVDGPPVGPGGRESARETADGARDDREAARASDGRVAARRAAA